MRCAQRQPHELIAAARSREEAAGLRAVLIAQGRFTDRAAALCDRRWLWISDRAWDDLAGPVGAIARDMFPQARSGGGARR